MVNNVGQFTGLQYTTVTNATLISAMTPSMTAFLAFIFLRERLTRGMAAGIALSFAGVVLIVSHGSWEIIRHIRFNFGDLLCLAAQFSWAVYTLLAAGVLKKMSPEWATGCASICGTAVAALYGFISGEISVVPLSVPAAASFVYIVLIGGIFSMVSWNLAVKKVGAGVPPIFLNIMPVVGMISGHFLFGDEIGTVQLLGAAAICSGVYLTTH